jgi:hypothetical protein
MDSPSLPLLLSFIVILTTITYLLYKYKYKHNLPSRNRSDKYKPIPQPPNSLPFLGHTHLISSTPHPQSLFIHWSRSLGEIYEIHLGIDILSSSSSQKRWIFLNSGPAVREIIERQSALTSSRPVHISANRLSGGRRMLLMPYGSRWRTLRGIMHGSRLFSTAKAAQKYTPVQEFEGRQLVYDILCSSSSSSGDQEKTKVEEEIRWRGQTEFYNHVRRYAASVVLTMVYGLRVGEWVS